MDEKMNLTPEPGVVLERPLWQIRLALMWRGLKQNWALFAENKIGVVGVVIILLFAVMAVIHPILMKTVWDRRVYDPIIGFDYEAVEQPAPPSAIHLLGTDALGRDVLSQLLYSTASEFALGLVAAIVTLVVATAIGAVAAYYGGVVDLLLMRLADIIIMTPFITLMVVLSAMFDLTLLHLALVIGILTGFGGTAVIIKSQALTVKVRAYIEAARVAGGSDGHIIMRHIIPNLMPLAFLSMMFTVTGAIFTEAVLSFFGLLNIRMSWGIMIYTTQQSGYLLDMRRWWLIYPASVAICLLCAAFYLVGRAMDEIVNPRLRKR
jgi:peptide/nickel transport system permease protein